MSRLIGLSDGRFVAADFIAEVQPSSNHQVIMVRMKDGQIHTHQPDYGSSLYRCADKLVASINEALAGKLVMGPDETLTGEQEARS